jgi:hypothetical protein
MSANKKIGQNSGALSALSPVGSPGTAGEEMSFAA